MPGHRLPSDLSHVKTTFPRNWAGIRIDGETVPLWAFFAGAPTGPPTAKFAFDYENGKFYAGTSGSWVEIGATASAIALAADQLTLGSVIVDPYKTVQLPPLSGAMASPTNGIFFIAPRAFTVTQISAVKYTALASQTLQIVKIPAASNVAPTDGAAKALLASAIDLSSSGITQYASTNGTLTSTAADLVMAAGDKLGYVSGTAWSSTGFAMAEVVLKPS